MRTAAEAGWHVSRYNLSARDPESGEVAIANLYRGTCATYGPIERFVMGALDEVVEDHPVVGTLARRGLIADFDERAALEAMARSDCARPGTATVTIAPTMACNFNCPYCFEEHRGRSMSPGVQDDVVGLVGRLLDASNVRTLNVAWFGGEPLLALGVIEALTVRLRDIAEERGAAYTAGIVTNGYLLDHKTALRLAELGVGLAEVTLDGIGAVHDATRHLAGGGPTFDRIVENLGTPGLPFPVKLRHNVHAGNLAGVDKLGAFVGSLAEESGNLLVFNPMPVEESEAARARGSEVAPLAAEERTRLDCARDAPLGRSARGVCCCAQKLWSVAIDECGALYKCQLDVDNKAAAFGHASDWDPTDSLATATRPDKLTRWLNAAPPLAHGECGECVWLPICSGGCPKQRLDGGDPCLSYKDDPESYVLAQLAAVRARDEQQWPSRSTWVKPVYETSITGPDRDASRERCV